MYEDSDSNMDKDSGYIPMQSVRSFRMLSEERHENIYESPKKYQKFRCIRKAYQTGKQVWRPILCLALPCSVLLVIVLLLAKNSVQRDELHHNYINLTRERETLKLKLYQLDRLKHDLTAEKTNLERRLDHIQGNMTKEIKRLQANISEQAIHLHNLTDINVRNTKKLTELGWYYSRPTWYYLSNLKRNWTYSQQDCKDRGGDLVVINSKEEQLFLADLAVQAWIGLTDLEEEGVWNWVDNTTTNETYWAADQPNNFKGQDCVVIWDRTNRLETWNDEKCDRKLPYICEI